MPKYVYDKIVEEAKNLLSRVGLEDAEIERPPEHISAFLAAPCFKHAKKIKKPPQEIASKKSSEIKMMLTKESFFSDVRGEAGYINFYPNWAKFVGEVLKQIDEMKDRYGEHEIGKNQRIIIDMSSPNIAKPMSVAHLRSTIIGDALARILRFLGYDAIRDNHLGDWGTQFGKLIYAFKKWGDSKKIEENGTRALLELYVKFHKEAEKNPDLENAAREEFAKLERGDKENQKLWEWFVSVSKKEFKKIYDILGVEFEYWLGESFYVNLCDKVIADALKKGVAKEGEHGEIVVNLEEYGLPNLIIRKSDESTLYATRDLATIYYRVREFSPVNILYVVGSEQKLYFQQIFKIAELLGYCSADRLKHIDFGLMYLPEGKLSTRKGRVIFLEDVFQKTYEKALKIIDEKNPALKNKEEVAKKVAVSAIKFADLSQNRTKDFVFDWERGGGGEGEEGNESKDT